jgi:hypothetical protein
MLFYFIFRDFYFTVCLYRFEEEIGLPIPEPDRHFSHLPDRPKVIGAHTYNEVQKQLAGIGPELHGLGLPNGIPPPPPPPMFVPHQVRPPQGRNREFTYFLVAFCSASRFNCSQVAPSCF